MKDSNDGSVLEGAFIGVGVFSQPNMDPPVNSLFCQLREQWRIMEPGRTSSQLAKLLGVASQNVSQWATGSDGRKPPWHVLMWLCEVTGHRIIGSATEWRIESVTDGHQ